MQIAGAEGGNDMHEFLKDVNQRPKFKERGSISFTKISCQDEDNIFKHFGFLEHFEAPLILQSAVSTGKK